MINKITDIETAMDRLEAMVRELQADRTRAWEEVSRLKKALDDREMELLQMDEEMQQNAKRFEEERDAMRGEQTETEQKLEQVALRIRNLLPLLPDHDADDIDTGGEA